MKIAKIEVGGIRTPLVTLFKTALRTVTDVNGLAVKVTSDTGHMGLGEAAPTPAITGETRQSISAAVMDYIAPAITGMDLDNIEGIMESLNHCIVGNTAAKAAVDMAVYDLFAQLHVTPLYQMLGGYKSEIFTDITISLNTIEEMVLDSVKAVEGGYHCLKIKVGTDWAEDIKRLAKIRGAVGKEIALRVDANQGYSPKEAVRFITELENRGMEIEFVEQPVKAWDKDGLRLVTSSVLTPIMADEAVFSFADAMEIIQTHAADYINIKLMKTGGIYNALKICAAAENYGVKCMMGCMMESKISVSAAAHLAAAKGVFTMYDLDGASLCAVDSVKGGPKFEGSRIVMPKEPGLGFAGLNEKIVTF